MTQKNFKRGRMYINIKTGKKVKLLAIGSKSAITTKDSPNYPNQFISSKNLRVYRRKRR